MIREFCFKFDRTQAQLQAVGLVIWKQEKLKTLRGFKILLCHLALVAHMMHLQGVMVFANCSCKLGHGLGHLKVPL